MVVEDVFKAVYKVLGVYVYIYAERSYIYIELGYLHTIILLILTLHHHLDIISTSYPQSPLLYPMIWHLM